MTYITFEGKDIEANQPISDELQHAWEVYEQLTLLLELSRTAPWTVYPQSGVIELSDQFIKFIGYSHDELDLSINGLERIHHPDEWLELLTRLDTHLKGITPIYNMDIRLLTKNSGWQWFVTHGKAVDFDPDGNPTKIVGMVRDISEIKARELELKKAYETVEEQVNIRTEELTQKNKELLIVTKSINEIEGILPICAECKKIRDDDGYWKKVDEYFAAHSTIEFEESICQKCRDMERLEASDERR